MASWIKKQIEKAAAQAAQAAASSSSSRVHNNNSNSDQNQNHNNGGYGEGSSSSSGGGYYAGQQQQQGYNGPPPPPAGLGGYPQQQQYPQYPPQPPPQQYSSQPQQYDNQQYNNQYPPPPLPPQPQPPQGGGGYPPIQQHGYNTGIYPTPGPPPPQGAAAQTTHIYDPTAPPPSAPPPSYTSIPTNTTDTVILDPSQSQNPPSYLSLIPPPPAFSAHNYFLSSTTNAPISNAIAGQQYCRDHTLQPPLHIPPTNDLQRQQLLAQISTGGIPLGQPNCHTKYVKVTSGPTSIVQLYKRARSDEDDDTSVLSEIPIYLANYHHPRIRYQERYAAMNGDVDSAAGETVVIGFDVHILGLPDEGIVAIGMACAPYPSFRLPGWNRGSFGVHSDDGRRYCNDDEGGIDCVAPFQKGEKYSVMFILKFFPSNKEQREVFGDGRVETEVAILKGGRRVAGWKVKEPVVEGREDPSIGLCGERDIYAAVGVAGEKGVELGVRIWGEAEAKRIWERVEAESGSDGGYVC